MTKLSGEVRGGSVRLLTAVLIVAVLAGCSTTGDTAVRDRSSERRSSTEVSSSAADCASHDWVAAWGAAPNDASFAQDATFSPLPERFQNQTVRDVITPHLGSAGKVRLHLTNRFNTAPVTFEKVTIGLSEAKGGVGEPVAVPFGGSGSITAAPGQDIVSDPVALEFDAFAPLAVSIYLPATTGQLTKHWNSNATTFITPPDAGDQTHTTSGQAFTQKVYSWLGVVALDVQPKHGTRAVVAFGDSLTDGWVGASATETKLDTTVNDKNVRYPDYLQHRLDSAHIPMSVVNAGIGGNMVLSGAAGPTGPSALDRFATDVPTVAGAKGVIIFEGINDLGLSQAPAASLIDGLQHLVDQAKAAKLKVWLATITPASDSKVDGVATAPNSERDRQAVNEWIRTKANVDGVIDFDKAVRDPANPAVLSTHYGSPDRLHLDPAGYEKLAATVDIKNIATATC